MVKTFMRKKSKRQSCRQKYKIDKKVREHKRKVKKEQKKKGKTKLKKDPGIPNLYPFKEQLLKQIEDKKQKDLKDDQRRKEHLQRDKKLKSLHNLKSDAEKRTRQFEQKQEWEEAMTDIQGLEIGEDGSRKAYYREFKRVVELSDVVLEVLDARDPLGCRCPQVEQAIIASGANKKLILVLNKIDLVPKSNVEAWLKHLRRDFPTVAFKASTQSQRQNLSRKKLPQGIIPDDVKESSACFGANVLMKLLGNYCRNADIRTSITVGIVGLPNVGKSSIINSLKRSRACSVGATPGVTKAMQEVQLDKHIKMLDCPGIVIAKSGDHSSAVLRNCIKVENLTDLTSPVEAILRRCNRVKVMEFYCIPEFADVHEFLTHVARRIGRLKKGGVPDVEAAARHVLHDWNSGRITFYTHPPEQSPGSERMSAEIVSEWSKAFDLDSIEVDEKQDLIGLDDKMEAMCVSMESSQPAEMEQLDSSDGSSDEEMYDSEDDDDAVEETKKEQVQVVTVVDLKKKQSKSKGTKSNAPSRSEELQLSHKFDGDVEMGEPEEYNFSEYY